MHQTTYGATHKTEVYDAENVKSFLEKCRKVFLESSLENCIYQNKKVIQSQGLNFLNLQDFSLLDNQLKYLIRNAYDESESVFPFLGDVFIDGFFRAGVSGSFETFKFSKKYEEKFIKDKTVKDIASWLFKNISLERTITVEKTHLEEVVIESNDDMCFDLEYDNSFLAGKFYHEMKDYKVVLIDGFIETVGEIHHLLYNAASSKLPHVLFCFGMSDEVKHTIVTNNAKGITEVFPVVMQLDTKTANILNDFAILHKTDVISSLSGQTISQAVRNGMTSGRRIVFFKDKIIIEPICSKIDIIAHRAFLSSRIRNAMVETDTQPIRKRLKNFTAKSTSIYVPEKLYNNVLFLRELDYTLSFLNRLSAEFVEYNNRLYPFHGLDSIQKKINSLKNTYHNIDKAVILSSGDKNAKKK